jgi:hypothetical protein
MARRWRSPRWGGRCSGGSPLSFLCCALANKSGENWRREGRSRGHTPLFKRPEARGERRSHDGAWARRQLRSSASEAGELEVGGDGADVRDQAVSHSGRTRTRQRLQRGPGRPSKEEKEGEGKCGRAKEKEWPIRPNWEGGKRERKNSLFIFWNDFSKYIFKRFLNPFGIWIKPVITQNIMQQHECKNKLLTLWLILISQKIIIPYI